MHDPKIIELQKELASQRETYRNHETSINHKNYQNTRDKIKKVMKENKANSLRQALSDKQPTKVCNTVDRLLNKQHNRIKLHPSDLNTHFTTLASRLIHKDNELHYFTEFFNTISEVTELETFKIKHTNYNEVRKIILGIKNHCSTGDDSISIRYIKSVVDDITSPMVNIINNCIDKNVFSTAWKVLRVCSIPKIDNPIDVTKYRPISALCILSKVFERVILTLVI